MKKYLILTVIAVFLSFGFSGCDMLTPNNPPTIDSDPVTSVTVGEAYSYDVEASDVDGDTLTFDLLTYPEDMTIDPTSGLISWTPSVVGTENVVVAVTDGEEEVTQEFDITVSEVPANNPPEITSTAVTEVILGDDYAYDVEATDADGDTLTYSLTTQPEGMVINEATGAINWTPLYSHVGDNDVVVSVTDGEDTATQEFTITVSQEVDLMISGLYEGTDRDYVAADCYDITVNFAVAPEEVFGIPQDVYVRWYQDDTNKGTWQLLSGDADWTEFTGELCFPDNHNLDDCAPVCVEVWVGDICCGEVVYHEIVSVDRIAPCFKAVVTVTDCGPCVEGASLSFTSETEDICAVPLDCCVDECSGVGEWSFILDDDFCGVPCDTADGEGCPIEGTFECGCLLYADTGEVVHVVEVSVADNVGNTFTDTWELTFDTDELVGIEGNNIDFCVDSEHDDNADYTTYEWTFCAEYDCNFEACEFTCPCEPK
jgi:hypothetical protein